MHYWKNLSAIKRHLSYKVTPLLPTDTFALSDYKDSTGNEDKDKSANVDWLKFNVVDGTSKDVAFTERL